MAKKVRRVKKKRQQTKEAESRAENTSAAVEATDDATDAQEPAIDQFQLDYSYVVKDLRRVLILAAVMFALLIALNLLLQ